MVSQVESIAPLHTNIREDKPVKKGLWRELVFTKYRE